MLKYFLINYALKDMPIFLCNTFFKLPYIHSSLSQNSCVEALCVTCDELSVQVTERTRLVRHNLRVNDSLEEQWAGGGDSPMTQTAPGLLIVSAGAIGS